MQINFPQSLKFILVDEGGNDDDPQDHGGRTSRGVIQREYTAWLAEHNRPNQDVFKATDEEIVTIYHDEYWNPWCDLLPSGSDYAFFDMCINGGQHRAIILGQRALGVAADGRVGPITRQAIKNALPKTLLYSFDAEKRAFYAGLHQPRFIKGWLNRCDHVMKNAMKIMGTN